MTTPIADNEPLVAIAPGVTPQEEGEIPGTFDLTLTQPAPAGGLVVDYEVERTATPGDDDEPLTGNILIPAGANRGTIEVATFDDVFIDPDETVIFWRKGRKPSN
ncbi:hypothetical protein [Lyngbya sp. CCY1209]|uniref:hypothetical protein n=1 Tax=Lyngbya sp. CCY1209 TaxID=2886103 RepID=UPI002D211DFC|nr:hypothetical protein [Lyngbya sp. CCY1209]MEB3885344.1 hypothetical protein [Lyngbya sp. CCY1209]